MQFTKISSGQYTFIASNGAEYTATKNEAGFAHRNWDVYNVAGSIVADQLGSRNECVEAIEKQIADSQRAADFMAATAPVAAPALTTASKALFADLWSDAGNWGGTPLLGGNVEITKEERGNLTQLKKAGLVTTQTDEDRNTWVHFTDAGEKLGAELDSAKAETVAAANVAETGAAFTVKLPQELIEDIKAEPVAEIINGKETGRFKVNGRYVAGAPKPKGTLKITVAITIELDRDAYEAEYAEAATVDEIRRHIKTSAVSAVESDLNSSFATIKSWA